MMEEKLRKIFNLTSVPPPVKSLPPSSPPSEPYAKAEQHGERQFSNSSSRSISPVILDSGDTIPAGVIVPPGTANDILSEREENIWLREQELQKREYNMAILEREMEQKLAEIVQLDLDLRTKIASLSQKEAELSRREECISKQEVQLKQKHPDELRKSGEFIVVDSIVAQKNKGKHKEDRPLPSLQSDDSASEDQEDWIVVSDDGFQDKSGSGSFISQSFKKITQNFKCNVPDCGRVIFVFETKYKCARCEAIFCLEHSACVQPISTIKSMKSDEILGMCTACVQDAVQTIGRTRDMSEKFSALRKTAGESRAKKISSREELVKSNLKDVAENAFPPANALSNVIRNNPLKNIVLTTKDTWKSCASCGAFFGRMTMKHVCRLCDAVFCEQCGNYSIEFSPVQLFSHLISQVGTIPRWQTVEIDTCVNCHELIQHHQRRHNFQQNLWKKIPSSLSSSSSSSSSLSSSLSSSSTTTTTTTTTPTPPSSLSKQFSVYTNLSVLYIELMAKLEKFREIVEGNVDIVDKQQVEETQDSIEELVSQFQDNVRLLHSYSNSYHNNNNYNNNNNVNNHNNNSSNNSGHSITHTEFRVLENTKVFFKMQLRDAVMKFQKYKQVYYCKGNASQPTEAAATSDVIEVQG